MFSMILSAAAGAIEIGFCDSAGNGFFTEQPADQLERWSLPKDNGSHVVVHWSAAKKACGLNITSYLVDVSSSLPLLDHATRFFGAFPQDICAGDSKARKTVGRKTDGVAHVELPSTCSPYPSACSKEQHLSAVPIPWALRFIARLDVVVTIRMYGTLAPVGRPSSGRPVVWSCHKYRRKVDEAAATSKPRPWWRRIGKPRRAPPPPPPAPKRTRWRDCAGAALGLVRWKYCFAGSAAGAADDDGKGERTWAEAATAFGMIGAGIALLIAPEAGEGWPRSAAEMRRTLSWRLQRIPSGWYTPDGAE